MTKRKPTIDERLAAVKEYTEAGKPYEQIARERGFSYRQVYEWVRKYRKFGIPSPCSLCTCGGKADPSWPTKRGCCTKIKASAAAAFSYFLGAKMENDRQSAQM